jgi:hypothetical protein
MFNKIIDNVLLLKAEKYLSKGQPQSRQKAKPFLQSSELGHQTPPPPPRFWGKGHTHSLAREGLGESQFR